MGRVKPGNIYSDRLASEAVTLGKALETKRRCRPQIIEHSGFAGIFPDLDLRLPEHQPDTGGCVSAVTFNCYLLGLIFLVATQEVVVIFPTFKSTFILDPTLGRRTSR